MFTLGSCLLFVFAPKSFKKCKGSVYVRLIMCDKYPSLIINCINVSLAALCFSIAPDKRGIQIIVFLFLHRNICCWYSLEAPH